MLIPAKLKHTNGGKVCFSNFMLIYICNYFDDLRACIADFRELVGGLIDPPPYLYTQPIKRQKSSTIFRLRRILRVCIEFCSIILLSSSNIFYNIIMVSKVNWINFEKPLCFFYCALIYKL